MFTLALPEAALERIEEVSKGDGHTKSDTRQMLEPCFPVRHISSCLDQGGLPVLAGSKPGARSAITAAQKAAPAQGQPKSKTGKDEEEAEAEKPPDTRTWLQVGIYGICRPLLDTSHHATMIMQLPAFT